MKLIVEFPIAVERAVPPRSQVRRTAIVKDEIVVDVPEYSLVDAPVVMRQPIRVNGKPDMVYNFRAIGDKLFTTAKQPVVDGGRVRYSFGFGTAVRMSPAFHSEVHAAVTGKASEICKSGRSFAKVNIYPEAVYDSYDRDRYSMGRTAATVNTPMLHDARFVSFDVESVEKARSEFAELASRVVLVDGKFMIAVPEPVYLADASNNVDEPTVTLVRDKMHESIRSDGELVPYQAYFAADDFDGAMEYAAEMWRLRIGDDEDYQAVFEDGVPIEVVDSTYVRFDGEGVGAAVAADAMCMDFLKSLNAGRGASQAHVLGKHLNEIDMDSFSAYRRLSAALSSFRCGEPADDIVAAARECLGGADGHRFADARTTPFVDLALGRWERRNMRTQFGLVF